MLEVIYPIISLVIFWGTAIYVGIMVLRVIFSFADPNPFGKIGRFEYQLRKRTNKYVQPFADFLFRFRIDKKWAPLLSALVAMVLAYFVLQLIANTIFIVSGFATSVSAGNPKALLGYLIYAALSIYVLLIFIRILSSWFVYGRNRLFAFARKATDPILIPAQRLIPPMGMFDFSAMVVLIIISILQGLVRSFLIGR